MSRACRAECPLINICQGAIAEQMERKYESTTLAEKAEADLKTFDSLKPMPGQVADLATYRQYRGNSVSREAFVNRKDMCTQAVQGYENAISAAITQVEAIRDQCRGKQKLRAKIGRLFGRAACGTSLDVIPVYPVPYAAVSKEQALSLIASRTEQKLSNIT